jgi:aryl-alcohol dehydrogenase-like predicted oxidoreductase
MKAHEADPARRDFLKLSAGVATGTVFAALGQTAPAAADEPGLPKRALGKTGMRITTLAFGGGSQFLKNKDGDWEPLLEKAIASGINYFDTHENYGTEERFGRILPAHREKLYIATKFDPRDEKGMMASFEQSLKRMKTDYVDVLMIHDLSGKDDVETLEKTVWKRMQRLKGEGAARFIGFSSMRSSDKSKEFIEKLAPDVALVALNPTKYRSYAEKVLGPTRKQGTGVLAMKVMRGIVGVNGNTPRKLIGYALAQDGVASAIIGHYGMNILEENLQIVRELGSAKAMSQNRQRRIEHQCRSLAGPHALCWARTDYHDDARGTAYA